MHPRGSCGQKGSRDVLGKFLEEVAMKNLFGQVVITDTGCLGPCAFGATVVVYPDAIWYKNVTPADVPEIIESHIKQGTPVTRLLLPDAVWG